ncbi:MAG TPA: hypothetical protein VFS21_07500, partial [Roseiflexaceae bacterium]|nr:hypothetical protein [Roseiflexaceae bacterium]
MDARTLPRAGLRDKVADVVGVLEVSLTNSAVGTDQRTKEAYESARYVQERVGQQQLHEVAYAVLVGGPTVRVLQERVERVQDQLSGWMRLEQVPGAQRAYAQLFSPTPASQIGAPLVRHPTLSEGLAVKLGWGYRKLRPTGGICWGYELHEGMPLYHDMWGAKGVENAHLMMIGRSGSGKTVALLTLALRHAVAGTQVVFFDPLGKSELLCNAVGPSARYYPVDTSAAINILDPAAPDLKRQRDVVARRISALLGRVLIKGEEVSYLPYELDIFMGGALDGALQDAEVYGADGKHLATLTPHDAPLLGNLVDALRRYAKRTRLPEEADAARLLASLIQSKLLGSSRHLFNQPTELAWHFDADVVGYNFAGADRELLPLYYESGFEALNAWVRSDRRKALYRHLLAILDEYRIMASFRELEQYVAFATKAWRNHGAAMWTADQNAITYFRDGNEWSAFTAENVAMTMIGLQEGSGAELLARVYRDRLSPDLLQSIRTASAGQFLLLTGNQAHQIAVELTDLEEEYFLRPVEQPRR